jgi:DNA-binding PadR family transcriptional regulator
MASRRKVNNLLGLAVLSYLSRAPMHPYEMAQTLRHNADDRSIKFNQGSLYMVVGQLAKAGFIEAQETVRAGQRPERTVYAITDAGRSEWRDWLCELVEEPEHEYPHFVAALSLIAALPPGEVVELLRNRLRRLGEEQRAIRDSITSATAQGLPPLFQIEEEYRLALLEADAAFVQQFIDRIIDPQDGWGRPWAEFLGTPDPAYDKENEQ